MDIIELISDRLLSPIQYCSDEESADRFVKENAFPEESLWHVDNKTGEYKLSLLGLINGVILQSGSKKRLVVEGDDQDVIESIKFEEYAG